MSLWRLALAVLVAYVCKPWRTRRYRQCLARIEGLEVALGMREAPIQYGPGAIWTVFSDSRQSKQNLYAAQMLKRDLMRSAFYASPVARPKDAQ